WVRPEVHSPDQREGDVANIPLFPNAAFAAKKEQEKLSAEAAVNLAPAEAAAVEKLRATEQPAKVEEATALAKKRGRRVRGVGLSPEQIAKAEELANWDFIKASTNSEEFRDHLARFPKGVTERMARTNLEALVWAGLPQPLDAPALRGFIEGFPNGAHAAEAT